MAHASNSLVQLLRILRYRFNRIVIYVAFKMGAIGAWSRVKLAAFSRVVLRFSQSLAADSFIVVKSVSPPTFRNSWRRAKRILY